MLALSAILMVAVPAAHAAIKDKCMRESLAIIDEHIEHNAFKTYRPFDEYSADLGPDFVEVIDNLGTSESKHWIDGGAGKARAQIEKLASIQGSPIRFTAVGVKIPDGSEETIRRASSGNNFRYLTGKIEEIPKDVLGKAHVITDFFGAVSYSPDLDLVLRTYFNALETGGSLFVRSYTGYTMGKHTAFMTLTIKTKSGILTFEEWLRTIKGIKVVPSGHGLRIIKESDHVKIPDLKLIDHDTVLVPAIQRFEVME